MPSTLTIVRSLALIVAYFVSWQFAALFNVATNVSAFYPAAGSLLFFIRRWGWKYLAVAVVAMFVANLPQEPFWVWTGSNYFHLLRQVVVYGGVALLACKYRWLTLPMETLSDALRLIGLALASALLSAILALPIFWTYLPSLRDYLDVIFLGFWVGDFSGVLFFVGLASVVLGPKQWPVNDALPTHVVGLPAPVVGLFASTFSVIGLMVFIGGKGELLSYSYLILLPVIGGSIWFGFRFGIVAAALANISAVVTYILMASQQIPALQFQLLCALVTCVGLVLGAAIDDRKKALARYVDLYEFAPVGYLALKANGRIEELNHTAEVMLGVDRKELLAREFSGLVAADDQAKWLALFRDAEQQGAVGRAELSLQRDDGTRIPVQADCTAHQVGAGDTALRVALTDLSANKAATAALRESQALTQALTEGTTDAIFVKDTQGRYLLFNSAASNFVGKPVAAVLGKDDTDLFPLDDARAVMAKDREIMASGLTRTFEEHVSTPAGPKTFLVAKGPIRDVQGKIIGLFGISRDITARQQAALENANLELRQLADEQSEHLRNLSIELTRVEQQERERLSQLLHDEIQPMLVGMRLSLGSIGPATSASQRDQAISETCLHIGNVLDVARTLSIELSPPLLREKGLSAALEVFARWVRTTYQLDVEMVNVTDVLAGESELSLLCFNCVRELVLNVAKHANVSHTTLTMRQAHDASLQICIEDKGRGFDPGASRDGTGLATITRRLGMAGGSLDIVSAPGAGASITLSLPAGNATPRTGRRRGESGKELA